MKTEEQKKVHAAYVRAYYARHPERVKKLVADWRTKNPERAKEQRKKYQAGRTKRMNANPEEYRAHRQKAVQRVAEWRKKNRERVRLQRMIANVRRRALERTAKGSFTQEDILEQFVRQGGKCFYCKKLIGRFHIDHKTPLSRGGSNWPSNLVCACARCNMKKQALTAEEFVARGGY